MNQLHRSIAPGTVRSGAHRTLQLLACCVLLASATARAEQLQQFGDLGVHYIVFNTMDLAPEMARQYDITRAPNRALVNISGRRNLPSGLTEPVAMGLSGTATNLLSQVRTLDFEEVREPGAVYYLATLQFTDREVLRFEIDVTERDSGATHTLRFQQELWREE